MTPVFRRGDDKAFERLYSRHVRDVYRYAAAMLDDVADAEDVTQTTFLNAYRSFNSGVRPERPRSWLLAIAHNVCRQRFRQAQRRPHEVAFDERVGDGQTTDEATTPSVEDLRRALGQLPANQRTALVMRELEGGSYAEIAEVLGISVSALETLLFRARQALREQLDENLTCQDAALAIHRQLDGRLPNAEKTGLRAHLRACAECTSLAQSLRAQRRALKTLVLVPVPASMSHWFGHETAATATGASGAGGLTAAGAVSGGGAGASSAVFFGAAAKIAAVVIAGVAIGGGTYTGVVIARHSGSSQERLSDGRDAAVPTRGELVSARVKGAPPMRVSAVRAGTRKSSATHPIGSPSSASTPGASPDFGRGQTSDPATASSGSAVAPGEAPSAGDHGGKSGQPTPPGASGKSERTSPPSHTGTNDQSSPPSIAANADQTATSVAASNGDTSAAGASSGDTPRPNQNANPRASNKTAVPGKAKSSAPVGQKSPNPPGQDKTAQNNAAQNKPGQNKPGGSGGQPAKPDAPPGQTRTAPSGQTKTATPPGQTKTTTPAGQTSPDTTLPAQTKTDPPPGQTKPDPNATPPGQSKTDTPPGQTPPGQTKTTTDPPGQTKPDSPPGQQNKPDTPPGPANQNPPAQTQDPAPQQQSQDTHSQGNKPPDPPGKKSG